MKKKKKQALGKSLSTLLGASTTSSSSTPFQEVLIDKLMPGSWQPRKQMDKSNLNDLAKTIAARGVLQPIVVRNSDYGSYEIIAGERRWRAAQLAGLKTVPIVIRDFSDQDALLVALVENTQREDLSVLEHANAAQRIVDELGKSISEVASLLGMSRPALSNLLRLRKLPQSVQALLNNRQLSYGHARVIAGLKTNVQLTVAKAVIEKQLSVRQVEEFAQSLNKRKTSRKQSTKKRIDADTKRLCDELTQKLGMRVEIFPRGKSGKLVVNYRSLDSLDSVVRKLRK